MPSPKNTVIEHAVDKGGAPLERHAKEEHQVEEERQADTVSEPGGFKNDPDDPTNPNEVRERHLRKLRP
jgi:hypothetical protein